MALPILLEKIEYGQTRKLSKAREWWAGKVSRAQNQNKEALWADFPIVILTRQIGCRALDIIAFWRKQHVSRSYLADKSLFTQKLEGRKEMLVDVSRREARSRRPAVELAGRGAMPEASDA